MSTPSPRSLCTVRALADHLMEEAAEEAVRQNPQNRPSVAPTLIAAMGAPPTKSHLALLTSKKWGSVVDLSVRFLDNPTAECKRLILLHANAWGATPGGAGANVKFRETTGTGDIRVTRGPTGYWSYLGTDCRMIPQNEATLNLEGFTERTVESEYRRVVRHEYGHALGFPHEQQRPEVVGLLDPEGCYRYFWEHDRWDRATVDAQILNPLSPTEIRATDPDVRSIMEYEFDGSCTRSGQPIPGGMDIDASDAAFARLIYPPPAPPTPPVPPVVGPPVSPPVSPPHPPTGTDARTVVWQVVGDLSSYGVRLGKIVLFSGFIWSEALRGIPREQIVQDVLSRVR